MTQLEVGEGWGGWRRASRGRREVLQRARATTAMKNVDPECCLVSHRVYRHLHRSGAPDCPQRCSTPPLALIASCPDTLTERLLIVDGVGLIASGAF